MVMTTTTDIADEARGILALAERAHQAGHRTAANPTLAALLADADVTAEFEHATVHATARLALVYGAKHARRFGRFLGFEAADDELGRERIAYSLKATSPDRVRFEARRALRDRLGQARGLLNLAKRLPRAEFLARLNEAQRRTLRERLALDPVEFWRAVRRGTPVAPPQLELFR